MCKCIPEFEKTSRPFICRSQTIRRQSAEVTKVASQTFLKRHGKVYTTVLAIAKEFLLRSVLINPACMP